MGQIDLERHSRWSSAWPIILVSVLTSTRWLVADVLPETRFTLWTGSFGVLLAAGLFYSGRRSLRGCSKLRALDRPTGCGVVGSIVALCGPCLATFSSRNFSAASIVLVLGAAPIVCAILLPLTDKKGLADPLESLIPAVTGFAGLLLILPVPNHSTLTSWLLLVAVPICTGVGAALCSMPMQQSTSAQLRSTHRPNRMADIAVGVAVSTAVLATLQRVQITPFSLKACSLDAALFSASYYAFVVAGGMRWSAQFLIAPLLSLVQGAFMLHVSIELRSIAGLLLLSFGSWRLLTQDLKDSTRRSLLDLV